MEATPSPDRWETRIGRRGSGRRMVARNIKFLEDDWDALEGVAAHHGRDRNEHVRYLVACAVDEHDGAAT